jgi:NAD(P)-dependent dehydrogenase (short-subunit alcohol dehydrogenase family)
MIHNAASEAPGAHESRAVALITGGTTGIGFATARLLHEHGYAVVATGQNPERIEAARKSLPRDVVVMRADARVLADTQAVADEIRERYGRLDALFLNAGVGPMQPIEAVDEASFDKTFGTNVKGQFFTLQKVLPLLRDGASIVWMTALGVRLGVPSYSVPTAAKGATMAMVAPLAVELAPRRIRVNAVSPAAIETPAFEKLGLTPEQLASFGKWANGRLLVGRTGTAEDVARLVGFLVTPSAAFINGACIAIDGGMSVSM